MAGCVRGSHILRQSIVLVFGANDIREKLQAAVKRSKHLLEQRKKFLQSF